MASLEVLRVEHDDLPGGMVSFSEDEVVSAEWPREQIVVEQLSQSNNLSAVYVGDERYEFNIVFFIFYQDTLDKLELVRHLREEFELLPAILEEPETRFTVIWPETPTLRERWVRGRREAHWELPLIWKESGIDGCPPVTIPS